MTGPSIRHSIGSHLLEPLLCDPLDLIEFIDRPIGPALDDPPGDPRPDPGQCVELRLAGVVDVDPAAGPHHAAITPGLGTAVPGRCRPGRRTGVTPIPGAHKRRGRDVGSGIGEGLTAGPYDSGAMSERPVGPREHLDGPVSRFC